MKPVASGSGGKKVNGFAKDVCASGNWGNEFLLVLMMTLLLLLSATVCVPKNGVCKNGADAYDVRNPACVDVISLSLSSVLGAICFSGCLPPLEGFVSCFCKDKRRSIASWSGAFAFNSSGC